MRLRSEPLIKDTGLGYDVYRSWYCWETMEAAIQQFRPDLVMVQSGLPVRIASRCEELDMAVVVYLRNVESDDHGGDLASLRRTVFLANSNFTSRWYSERLGLSSRVVYPLLEASRYRTQTDRSNVTLINPHPHKGGEIALEIARLVPEIPFVFVEAWTLDRIERKRLRDRLAKLPNVVLRPPTCDMREIYRHARIVIAPSQWQEAFGRVAAEAHCSGIPVIASDIGGLPEAVGPGGLLMARNATAEDWARAIKELWHDGSEWSRLSAAALRYSQRDALNPDRQIEDILQVLTAAFEGRRTA